MCQSEHPNERQSFGELLFAFRSHARVSQAELARRSGLSKSYISGVENGRLRSPAPASIARIAAALDSSAACERSLLDAASAERQPAIIFHRNLATHVLRLAGEIRERADRLSVARVTQLQALLAKED